jgi:hypothetical protein
MAFGVAFASGIAFVKSSGGGGDLGDGGLRDFAAIVMLIYPEPRGTVVTSMGADFFDGGIALQPPQTSWVGFSAKPPSARTPSQSRSS